MTQLLPYVDLVIANEEDAADVLNIEASGTSIEHGQLNAAAYEQVARAIVAKFPNVSRVAITLRESFSPTTTIGVLCFSWPATIGPTSHRGMRQGSTGPTRSATLSTAWEAVTFSGRD